MANFIKSFDCKNEDHVLWLKKIGGVMAKSMTGEKINVEAAINDNPLPGSPKISNVADWAYVHFQLSMKYSNAVLDEEAFVPKTK